MRIHILFLIINIHAAVCFLFGSEDVNMCRTFPDDLPCNCDTFTKVLDCNRRNLTFLYDSMEVPNTIVKLDFSQNQIKKITRDHFDRVLSVEVLDLSQNLISDIEPNSFDAFTSLKKLVLSKNAIKGLDTTLFGGLELLEDLDLSYNQLSHFNPESSLTLMSVTYLYLQYNPLGDALVNSSSIFASMPKLEYLGLENVDITNLSSNLFENNKKLTGLSLARNQLQEVPMAAVSKLQDSLEFLDLSDNMFKTIDKHTMPALPRLQILYLNNMPELENVGDYAFKDLLSMRILQMHYNSVLKSISSKAFHTTNGTFLPNLRELHLRKNQLEKIPHQLVRWGDLQTLDLQENPWVCDCSMHWTTVLLRAETLKQMRCAAPKKLVSRTFNSVPPKDFTCELTEVVVDLLIAVACVLIITVILAVYAVVRYVLKDDGTGYSRVNAKAEQYELEWDRSDLGFVA